MKPSLDTVHPELQQAAKTMGLITFNAKTLWLFRGLTKILFRWGKAPAGIQISNIRIPGPDKNSLRLRIYKSLNSAPDAPALLWMHGGGYIGGLPEMDDAYMHRFVDEVGVVVVSVDYRLAPEHPFPAPLEDCYAALKWLAAQAETLGIDPRRMILGGNSAGAGLAAALAQLSLDRGEVRPIFQLLVYPMLDDRTAARQDIDPQANFGWNNTSNEFGWRAYLNQPPGQTAAPAGAVPARRADLSGLPPAWIGVGAIDLFHDEDVRYAERLKAAGVDCELVVVPGAFHGFDVAGSEIQIVRDFHASQVRALKNALK